MIEVWFAPNEYTSARRYMAGQTQLESITTARMLVRGYGKGAWSAVVVDGIETRHYTAAQEVMPRGIHWPTAGDQA